MKKEEFNSTWSDLHGGTDIKGIVKTWLAISFASAKFLSKLHITPNILTLLGVLFAIAMAANPLSLWAIPLLVLSLYADGIDGSVAIFQKRQSSFGAILDSVADRISEALWFYVAYRIGAPAWLVLATYVIASTQEYARARLTSLGISGVGVVTPAERPVRASFIFIALVSYSLSFELVTLTMAILAILQALSFGLVARFAHNSLRNNLGA
ncbi:MAG: CDP-alcohol phosphatidyltransferase family protein [Actinobacteria bacterium]|nr:CDP-alcohol phosphatidyltransferase family protein [Actinomycetota bacterium]